MTEDNATNGDREMEDRLEKLQAEIEEYRKQSGELRLALETLTNIDHVTGARNRSGILQSIEGALQWNRREGTPFGVMALRIPGLAEIDAGEAHEVSNEAMAHTAALVSAGLRAVDRVGRVGSDLFLLVLAKLEEEDGATVVSRRVASILSAVPFQAEANEYPLTPRITCALIEGGAATDADTIVRRLEESDGSEDPGAPEMLYFRASA